MKTNRRNSSLATAQSFYADDPSSEALRLGQISDDNPAKAGMCRSQNFETPNANTVMWSHMVAYEARNALQIILSGGEIMLDGQAGRLTPAQRTFVLKILDNARHLTHLIATLTRTPDPALEDDESGVGGLEVYLAKR
jgi:hypothetical protein